eukprot:tig00021348_g20523.t1
MRMRRAYRCGPQVLRLCLEEVARSKYFIGFLKDRYGWHQAPNRPKDTLLAASFARAEARFPFVRNYTDRSATELEILLGAFINAIGETRSAIRTAGLPVTLPEYSNSAELATAIHDDVMAMLERDFPAGRGRSWLEGEMLAHAAFGDTRRRLYVPIDSTLAALDAYAASDGPELALVIGPSGCGKSALLANWAEAWQAGNTGDFVLVHFVGGSQQSARLANLLRHVYEALRDVFPEVPMLEMPMATGDPEEALAFRVWLASTLTDRMSSQRVVLVVDALDQLLDEAGAQRLQWLPAASPRLRLVVSCVLGNGQGEAERSARQRPHLLCEVDPLQPDQRRVVAHAELKSSGKELSCEMLDRLCNAKQTSNPLFLLTVLHELRDAAVFDTLDAQLSECLSCPEPVSLFSLVASLSHSICFHVISKP